MRGTVAAGHVRQPPAIRRPGELDLELGRRRDSSAFAAVLGRCGEYVAVRGEGDLLSIGREGEPLKAGRHGLMIDTGRGARAAKSDRHFGCLATRDVERPDAEVALENDRRAIVGVARPDETAILERRHLLRL